MNQTFLATFEREEDLLKAADKARQGGFLIRDIYAPYPVHGTDRALGLRRSRLPAAAFVFGLLGLALAFSFQFWVSAIDWPINVGGRPWNSLPAFVPVAFEMMVLCGGLGLVLTWLVVCRLYPGKKPRQPSDRVGYSWEYTSGHGPLLFYYFLAEGKRKMSSRNWWSRRGSNP